MPGWNDGIIGMQPGGKRLLLLPPAMGYGARGVQGIVPPNASLIFIIELLDLEKDMAN
jgi:FKBP-type peptidyl-prolyl cis-trans isomerase